jgi:hypothetical protein
MTTSIVVLGLPRAGKSSFIAATSHILQFNEIHTLLRFDRLSAEDKYLFELRSAWQNCKPFARTTGGPVHAITMHLKTEDGNKVNIYFPDVAGEEFEEQWRGREWSLEFTAAIFSATGLLLFINPITLEKPLSKADVANAEQAILDALGGENGFDETPSETDIALADQHGGSQQLSTGEAIAKEVANQNFEDTSESVDPKIWNPRDADAQVKIVDVLQSIAAFGDEKQWTLGIVISAWDVVRKQMGDITPEAWLNRECPLVSQFLKSSDHNFKIKVFGVSAQGGDPQAEGEKLRSFDAQSERVEVVYDGYKGHDLTRVLAWTMVQQ